MNRNLPAGAGVKRETKRIFRWFWAWADEREEAWLTAMARHGWHLTEPGLFGFYTFEHGLPRNVVYRLDYKTSDRDKGEYVQLFADAGWEHVGTMGGWQYFRKEALPGETPEIYTDTASKIQKYQRLLLILIVLMPIYLVLLPSTADEPSTFYQIASLFAALLIMLFVYAMVRLFVRIQELRKRL